MSSVWEDKVLRLAEITSELGRLPKQTEPMGKFLSVQRQSKSGKGNYAWSKEREEFLDRTIPEWNGLDRFELWKSTVLDVVKNVSKTTGNFDKAGRIFLGKQRMIKRGTVVGRWSKEHQEFLDEHIPDWELVSRDSIWESNVLKLSRSVSDLGRLPSQSEAMGTFLNTQRQAKKGNTANKWSQDRQDFLDKHVPDWESSKVDSEWESKVLKFAGKVRELGRLPKQFEDTGVFLISQRQAKNGTNSVRWNEERQDFLDKHVPSWDSVGSADRAEHIKTIRKQLEDM